ncbi:MAG: BON domain-containing protein [Bryobacteraceae bacterium]
MKKLILNIAIAAVAFPALLSAGPTQPPPIEEQVRVALVKIPFLSVFDNISYRVDSGVVTLSGQAVQPIIKSYAEQNVKRLTGVTAVNNEIEVLPLSRFDDDIRLRTFFAVRNTSSLYRYFLGVNPSIRIVVKNGRVTLDGIVNNAADRQMAFMAANRIPFVFSVTNNLRTEK